ncbi:MULTISPECIES: RHS repeat domain-containing protein [unclassified Caulobacter]|uniref:RHS repeat domain-containing protein n=1 Tax=unclassified Caulobacter TaxID=2648921 RepID=UPI00138F90A9|nr:MULTISPECIES: RHS repeat-associated core domain-containing protein [unclassified Caulobacter]
MARIRALLLGSLAMLAVLAGPAPSRADEIPPPKIIATDDNGVDLVSGVVSITELANSIGPKGPGSIEATNVLRGGAPLISSLWSYVKITDDGVQRHSTLVLNGQSQAFSGTAGLGDTAPEGDSVGNFVGVANSATGIVYVGPDGTKAVFNYVVYDPNHGNGAVGYLRSITYPSGETLTYSRTGSGSALMLKVESSLGYALITPIDFRSPFVANLTQGNCTDTACGGPTFGSEASQGHAVQQVNSGSTTTFTSASGDDVRVYNIIGGAGIEGQSTSVVGSVSRGGQTWTYAYNYAQDNPSNQAPDGILTVTMTAPDGYQRVVRSRIGNGHILSDQQGKLGADQGRTTYYSYGSGSVPGAAGSTGATAGYGRLHIVTMPEGDYFEYTYDGYANIISRKHYPKGYPSSAEPVTEVKASYSCRTTTAAPIATICNQPDWIQDENSKQTDFTYDLAHGGAVATVTRPAGPNGVRPQTRYTYQSVSATYIKDGAVVFGAPAWRVYTTSACRTQSSCVGTADEMVTQYGYESGTGYYHNARLTSVTTRAGDNSVSATTTYAYNARGDVIETDGPLPGNVDLVQTRYNDSRWVVGTVGPDPDGGGPLQYRAAKSLYRADGQVQTAYTGVVADRSDVTFANSFQVKTSVTSEFDGYGRVVARVSATGGGSTIALTQTSYDALGRVDCVAQRMNASQFSSRPAACSPGVTGSEGYDRISKTLYDRYGQVKSQQSGVGVDLIEQRRADYTLNGKLASETDGENNLTTYVYDGLDRLKFVYYPSTTKGANAVNGGDYELFGYDPAGNVTSWRLRDGRSITGVYDNLSRLRTRTVDAADVAGATYTYGYDNADRPNSISDGTRTLTQDYDALGRMKSESGGVGTVSYEYDAAGRRTKLTWPDTSFFVTYEYDNAGQLTFIRRAGSTAAADKIAGFAYDDLGRRVGISRGATTASTTYSYDPTNLMLSSIAQAPTSAGDSVNYDFTYNAARQVKSRTISNTAYVWNGGYAVDRPYNTDGLNRVVNAGASGTSGYTTYGYDGRGNLLCVATAAPACTSTPTTQYKYDAENRLRGTTAGASLVYDPLGRLYSSTTVGGTVTRYLYDGVNLIGEYDASSSTPLRRYVFGVGMDEPLARYVGTGTTPEWLLADHQGSIIATLNSAGAVTSKNTYDEYGVPGLSNAGLFQYTGQVYLSDLSLYHYKARAYSPTLGRFLQTDPVGYSAGMNWYAYVGNDPLNRNDPTGLVPVDPVVIQGRSNEEWARIMAQQEAMAMANLVRDVTGNAVDAIVVTAKKTAKKIAPASTCPVGPLADFARNAREFGSSMQSAGDWTAVAGMGVAGLGAVTLQPEIVAAGGVGVIVGKGVSVAGLGVQLLAGAYLYQAGDPEPLTSTAVGQAVGGFLPPALPGADPAGDIGDAAARRIYGNLPSCK